MLQLIYDFLNSEYIGILFLVWTTIDVIWISKWQALFRRIRKILLKPSIFVEDVDNSDNDALLYPRKFLEQLALRRFGDNTKEIGSGFWESQKKALFDSQRPMRTISYITLFVLFLLFLLADAIAVAQTLGLLGLDANFLPPSLNKIEISILGGAVFAAVVGIWFFIEVSGDPTKPSPSLPFEEYSVAQRNIIRGLSILIFILSIIISIALAVQRLVIIGTLQANPTLDFILSFILFGLITINVFIAAAVTFVFAQQGFLTLLYIVSYVLVGILPIIVFFIDVIWRIVHVILDFVIWYLFTPFLAIPAFIKFIIGLLTPKPSTE